MKKKKAVSYLTPLPTSTDVEGLFSSDYSAGQISLAWLSQTAAFTQDLSGRPNDTSCNGCCT